MIDISRKIKKELGFNFGKNKTNELARLVFEIHRREKVSLENVIKSLYDKIQKEKIDKGNYFSFSKKYLMQKRFPLLSFKKEKFTPFLNQLDVENIVKDKYKKDLTPEQVYIVKEAENKQFTQNFLKKLPSETKVIFINSLKEYKPLKNNIYSMGKRNVFITLEKYDMFKPCPCTKYHIGCGYQIMNLVFGCPMDCSYCYLQHYQNFPGIILNANLDEYFIEFRKEEKKFKEKYFRLGTGEFSDSLALDKYTGYSKRLAEFFGGKKVFFELKTKTDDITALLSCRPSKNVVISWSLNPQKIIEKEELYTADLNSRLKSAEKCRKFGYGIGFHFDPVFFYQGWEKDYKKVVDKLFKIVSGPISWISLGTLRFNPKLKSAIEKRFPESNIAYSEFIIAEDGKLRYPEFIRERIYGEMMKYIKHYEKKAAVYLCMESSGIWRKTADTVKSSVENYIVYQALKNL